MANVKKRIGEEGNHAPTRSAVGSRKQCQTNWNYNKILVLIAYKHKKHVVKKNLVDPKS